MKVLVINRVDFSDPINHGIRNKLLGQLSALKNLGHIATGVHLDGNIVRLVGSDDLSTTPAVGTTKYHLYHNVFYRYLHEILPTLKPDLVIVRFHLFHLNLLRFLKACRAQRSQVIMEFPTYPFHAEYTSWIHRARMLVHRRFVHKISKHIDRLFHYGSGNQVLQRPSLRISNGIDVDQYELTNPTINDEVVTLIAVGKWQKWHGIDRILFALAARKEQDMRLLIVGETPYLKSLQTQQVLASQNIEFFGALSGKKLSQIYSQADVGVGALGLHRNQLFEASPLKHREYCARGFPFIYATEDLDFDQCDFVKRFPVTDEALDLEEIRAFCMRAKTFSRENIRAYAQEHLGWEGRMSKVVNLVDCEITQ